MNKNANKMNNMKYKQMIKVGRHIRNIFDLPCVNSVFKTEKGLPLYEVYAQNAKWASVGQWLCEDEEGQWWVLDNDKVEKGGRP